MSEDAMGGSQQPDDDKTLYGSASSSDSVARAHASNNPATTTTNTASTYAGPAESEIGAPGDDAPAQAPEAAPPPQERKKNMNRVRFNSNAASLNPFSESSRTTPYNDDAASPYMAESPLARPKPSVVHDTDADMAAAEARERARQVAAGIKHKPSAPSLASAASSSQWDSGTDVPLQTYDSQAGWLPVNTSSDDDTGEAAGGNSNGTQDKQKLSFKEEAWKLLRTHTKHAGSNAKNMASEAVSVAVDIPTEANSKDNKDVPLSEHNNAAYDGLYEVAAPQHTRGLLTEILSLYRAGEPSAANADHYNRHHHRGSSAGSTTDFSVKMQGSPKWGGGTGAGSSTGGASTPRRKWYDQDKSQETLSNLIGASAKLANPNAGKPLAEDGKDGKGGGPRRPGMKPRGNSGNRLSTLLSLRQEEEERVTKNIANILGCQDYIVKLCQALMLYGAPTHRLEEYLSTSANFLKIAGQFLYLPGCMIIGFDDSSTHTTEVRMVRSAQSIDLGKLKDVHHIYKEVIHDVISADQGRIMLEDLMKRRDKFHSWFRVLVFGMTSLSAAPFSFKARFIDLPLLFFFGCIVGWLSIIVAPKSKLYNNVFEISTTVGISFLARAFGSIKHNGETIFCFSSLAQGGIVMLLPGYSVLCSSLELQSRAIIPGSIRIVHAIIYSLFLGFGITVGALLFGLIDSNATSETTCSNPMDPYYGFAFVPLFVFCICLIYQAKWRQMPVMLVVASAGYIVNYFSSQRFTVAPQIANTIGAFAVGVLANLYSRIRHGVAAAILIPAIFTQVPGGLASNGGLVSGLKLANEVASSNSTHSDEAGIPEGLNSTIFNLAASMIQIAIGIAVGLFLSALLVYPLGKRRSGLFSF